MSWPQWPSAGTVQPWPGAMAASNAAGVGPLTTPGTPYTPEQWAAMQQQNWQQWMQWQQQMQQWQQTYGEQYQKSVSALTSQSIAAPVLSLQPPLPALDTKIAPPPLPEIKPPLPPDDPPKPPPQMTQNLPPVSYNASVPPPNMSQMPSGSRDVNPGFAQNRFGTQKYPQTFPNQQQANPSLLNPSPLNPSSSNQSQTQLPSLLSLNVAKPDRNDPNSRAQNYRNDKPEYGKRPAEFSDNFDETKKNRWENQSLSSLESNKSWNSSQSNQRNPQRNLNQRPGPEKPPIQRPNVEELSDAEKNFDKQFEEWEAQFNKWKDQNAGHPDKQQYKEYEARWESWRAQLLERREQMRRKRLGLVPNTANKNQTSTTSIQPLIGAMPMLSPNNQTNPVHSPLSEKAVSKEPVANKIDFDSSQPEQQPIPKKKEEIIFEKRVSTPTNSKNVLKVSKSDNSDFDNSLLFVQPPKEQRTNVRQRRLSSRSDNESIESSFLKTNTFSNEIPGLDLVKDDTEKMPDNMPQNPTPEVKGPDYDAISKGINSILGDEKIMSILSMVSQNKRQEEANLMNEPNRAERSNILNKPNPNVQEEFNINYQVNDSSVANFSNDFNVNSDQASNKYDASNFNQDLNQDWQKNRGPNDPNSFGRNSSAPDDFRRNTPGNFNQQGPPDRNFGFNKMNQDPENFNDRPNFRHSSDNFNQGFMNRNLLGNRNLNPSQINRGPANDFNQFSPNRRTNDFQPRYQNEGNEYNEGPNRQPNFFNQSTPNRSLNFTESPSTVGPFNFNRDSPNKQLFEGNQGFGRCLPRPGNYNFPSHSSPGSNFKPNQLNRPYNYPDRDPQNNFNKISPNKNYWRLNECDTQRESPNFPNRNSWPEEANNFDEDEQDFEDVDQMSPHIESPKYDENEPPFEDNEPEFENTDTHDVDDNSRDENLDRLSNSNEFANNQVGPDLGVNRWSDPPRCDFPGPDRSRFPSDRYSLPGPDPYNKGGQDKYWDEALILKPVTVVDYGHKSLNKMEPETFIEPIQTFDYGHSSKNVEKTFEKDVEKSLPNTKYSRYNESDYKKDYNKPIKQYGQKPPEPSKLFSFNRNKSSEEDKPYGLERRPYDNRKNIDRNNKYYDGRPYNRYENKSHRERSNEREIKNEQYLNKPNPSNVKIEEKSSSVTMIEDLLSPPGRNTRPPRIVIILRGPPGGGKTFLAKLIKDKEVEHGGSAPRILSLDDYFMIEQDKETVEEETGRKTVVKEMVYEYEECMELSYRQSLEKAFKKTITDGFFPFIILDCINDKIKHFSEMWSFAKQNGFQVYICQMELDVAACTKRNIHHRSEVEIERLVAGWEPTLTHYLVLDGASLIQSGCISEVEMEEVSEQNDEAKEDDENEDHVIVSKWERMEQTGEKLARLDGISKPLRARTTMEDYLQLDDNIPEEKPGQKRVRWADLEERRRQEKIRAIGFVVGQTDWGRMMDPTQGSSALTQTKYIERVRRF